MRQIYHKALMPTLERGENHPDQVALCTETTIADIKNQPYDKLRRTDALCPQLLVIYEMPKHREAWLEVSLEKTVLQRCAFWVNLHGKAEVKTDSVAVRIPIENVFDDRAIIKILSDTHEKAIQGQSWG